ncbi:MAG: glycosyltransferase [bacterium]
MAEKIPKYSVVVAVYNRPDEISKLLDSLNKQLSKDFEVIIVEDGSSIDCKTVITEYSSLLDIHYFFKENSGQGDSRNFGVAQAKGEYIVFFDSDCIIPQGYFLKVEEEMHKRSFDAWGGPDSASDDFNSLQKAISHTMTSYMTTGGIRGAKKQLGSFEPRSFNFGIRKSTFIDLGGFHYTNRGEDIELSHRLKKEGYHSILISEAFVYHKRRTTLSNFFKQVFSFGQTRIFLKQIHPGSLNIIHLLPLFFTLGFFSMPIWACINMSICYTIIFLYSFYLLAVGVECVIKTKSLTVTFLAVVATWIQMIAYGTGFIREILKKTPRKKISY